MSEPPDAVDLFHRARELPAGPEREAYLEQACGADRALRAKLEVLLAADAEAGGLFAELDEPDGEGTRDAVTLEGEGREASATFSSRILTRLSGRERAAARYRFKDEVARGGMGAIRRVWDEDLRRHLAMKVMLGPEVLGGGGSSNTPAEERRLARFLEEAQVTGQLEHPGIVPVHELGLDSNGRVYFTMKLVQGRTLGDVFREFARGEGGWPETRVLGLLLRVCEAMAYAHDKGVIHRDLKPANIMVGRYGEVYVMDWGVARIVGRESRQDIRLRPEPGSSAKRGDRDESAAGAADSPLFTMEGDVVGTPAYMPPEQAVGRIEEMSTRSDVYALGAMLYHLLAGRAPYVFPGAPHSGHAVLARVQAGPPAPLHEVVPRAPVELVAICERAMARQQEERYADMGALAEDLSAYVEGRVVRAHETGAWAEARKWVRRNRSLAAALAAVLVVTVGGLGGIGYVQAEGRADERVQRERARDAEQEALAAAERATLAEADARMRADELEQVAAFQAEQLIGLDVEHMGVRLRRALIDAAPLERREQLAKDLAGLNFTNFALGMLKENVFDRTLEAIDTQFAEQPLVQARLLQAVARTLVDLGLVGPASDPQVRALSIRRRELGDEHPDTLSSVHGMSRLLMSQGEPSQAELYEREFLAWCRRVLGEEHRDTLSSIGNLGALLQHQGRDSEAEPYLLEALEGLRRNLGNDDPDTLGQIRSHGIFLANQGRLLEAEPLIREALEGSRRVLGEEHPETLSSLQTMGAFLMDQGKPSEAEPYYRKALEGIRRARGDEHRETLELLGNVMKVLWLQGKYSESQPYARQALEGQRRVLGDDDPLTLVSIHNMGMLLKDLGRLSEAEPYFREALEGRRRLLGDNDPTTLESIGNLGRLVRLQGRLSEAEPYYREALLGGRRVLGEAHPLTRFFDDEMVGLLGALADAARESGDDVELGEVLGRLGGHLVSRGRYAGAETALLEALELLDGDPYLDARIQRATSDLGAAIASQGRMAEAEPILLESAEWVLATPRSQSEDAESALTIVQRVIDLYGTMHALDPSAGHDAKAEDWRARLAAWSGEEDG